MNRVAAAWRAHTRVRPAERMPGRGALVAFLLPVLLGATSPAPRPTPAAVEERPGPAAFLPLEEIRPGMQGTARTVFEGDNLEEFNVEILGVLKNAIGPQQDLIIARLRGERVEYTGVVSGMSGSPVYIGGKLVGALSYRLGPFAKEAIAGITPIADMVKLAAPSRRAASPSQAPDLLGRFLAAQGDGGSAIQGRSAGETGRPAPDGVAMAAGGGPPGGFQPIGIPLVCSGCDAGVLRYYAPIFESFGLEPTAGGGVVQAEGQQPLVTVPPIGAALATGDLSVVGIGTLTHIDHNRVFAFGHPLLGMGAMEMPMTQAQVLLTFPSAAASFKIANATPPVGSIFQDGLTAIVGEVGRPAPTIPVSVPVTSGAARREFHYEILRSRTWSSVLLASTTANSSVRTTA